MERRSFSPSSSVYGRQKLGRGGGLGSSTRSLGIGGTVSMLVEEGDEASHTRMEEDREEHREPS